MRLSEKIDHELLIYLDRNHGHLLSSSDVSLPSPREQFGAEVLRVEPLDRLQLLVAFACPPAQMALRSIQGLTPSRRPAMQDNSIASVRSLLSCREAVKRSALPAGIARLGLTTDPYRRDPTAHPGYSRLPAHWRAAYAVVGQLKVFISSFGGSSDNSIILRFGSILLVLTGILLSLNRAPKNSAGSSPPEVSEAVPASTQNLSRSVRDSVLASTGVPTLRGLRKALAHFPARPPVPDSLIAVSSEYGWRIDPIDGDSAIHGGVDLAIPESTVLLAPARAVVSKTGRNMRSGRYLRLDHAPLPYQSSFAHLSEIFVEPGDTVDIQDPVALTGSSGRVTGPHLHFRVDRNGSPVNPAGLYRQYLALRDSFMTQSQHTQSAFDQSIRRIRSRSVSKPGPSLASMVALRSEIRPLLTLPQNESQ